MKNSPQMKQSKDSTKAVIRLLVLLLLLMGNILHQRIYSNKVSITKKYLDVSKDTLYSKRWKIKKIPVCFY